MRRTVTALLANQKDMKVVGQAADGRQAVVVAQRSRPDVVLLSDLLANRECIEIIKATKPAARVVVLATYRESILGALAAGADECILKDSGAERLAAAIARARTFLAGRDGQPQAHSGQQARSVLCARLRGSLRLIPLEDVHYLHAEEKYVIVHHARGEDLIEESLKSLEEEFGERFVRIHRNCLVARHEVVELKRCPDGHVQAVLRHGKQPLEVSRRCVSGLRETLKQL